MFAVMIFLGCYTDETDPNGLKVFNSIPGEISFVVRLGLAVACSAA